MDALDLMRRWQEVRITCEQELRTSSPVLRSRWEAAREAAASVARALEPVVKLEKAAIGA